MRSRWISWNLVDFMHEIWWISWNLVDFMKLADFTMKFGRFHEIWWISCQGLWFWWKIQHSVVDHVILYICIGSEEKSTIHEIQWIHGEIRQISWNPADFMMEIWQISSMKSGGFHGWSWKMQTWKCNFSNKIVVGVLIKFSSIVQIVNSIKAKRSIRIDFKTNSCKTVIKGLFSSSHLQKILIMPLVRNLDVL